MKLFFSPGSCALAPHIVMAELNMAYELEAVNLKDKTCASGDFRAINPKGSVPALLMDNNEVLTEGAIISQYLVDQKNEGSLLGKFGTLKRTRTLEWLNFIATEVHKNFSPLFSAERTYKSSETIEKVKEAYRNTLKHKLVFISERLGASDYLTGPEFTIADAYMFTCLSWAKMVGLDLSAHTNITQYQKRISERPAVMKAMKEEGLI